MKGISTVVFIASLLAITVFFAGIASFVIIKMAKTGVAGGEESAAAVVEDIGKIQETGEKPAPQGRIAAVINETTPGG